MTDVRLYTPTVTTAPAAYIYEKSLERIAKTKTGLSRRSAGRFYLLDDAVLYHHDMWFHHALYISGNNTPKALSEVQESIDWVFANDTSFHFGWKDEGFLKPLPLAKLSPYHLDPPKLQEYSPELSCELKFVDFLGKVGTLLPSLSDQFTLLSSIEENYLPQRFLSEWKASEELRTVHAPNEELSGKGTRS